MANAIISIGSNIENRKENLIKALQMLEEHVNIIKKSSIYETEPYGLKDQKWFLNMVVSINTGYCPFMLLEKCKEIENTLGRKREKKWGPRIIDLDILFYNDVIIKTDDLIVPHKEISKRNFVLMPLKEIEPDYIHPVENKTISQLLEQLDSTDKVYLVE